MTAREPFIVVAFASIFLCSQGNASGIKTKIGDWTILTERDRFSDANNVIAMTTNTTHAFGVRCMSGRLTFALIEHQKMGFREPMPVQVQFRVDKNPVVRLKGHVIAPLMAQVDGVDEVIESMRGGREFAFRISDINIAFDTIFKPSKSDVAITQVLKACPEAHSPELTQPEPSGMNRFRVGRLVAAESGTVSCPSLKAFERFVEERISGNNTDGNAPDHDERIQRKYGCNDQGRIYRIVDQKPERLRESSTEVIAVETPDKKWTGYVFSDFLKPIVPNGTELLIKAPAGFDTFLFPTQSSSGGDKETLLPRGTGVKTLEHDPVSEDRDIKVQVTTGEHAGKIGWLSWVELVLPNGESLVMEP